MGRLLPSIPGGDPSGPMRSKEGWQGHGWANRAQTGDAIRVHSSSARADSSWNSGSSQKRFFQVLPFRLGVPGFIVPEIPISLTYRAPEERFNGPENVHLLGMI